MNCSNGWNSEGAIVIGAGFAGLMSARILSNYFEQVTVIDRDRLPEGADARDGTPHAQHVHALMARGQQILDELFPGMVQELIDGGATVAHLGRDLRCFHYRWWKKSFASDLTLVSVSRPRLELEVRKRLMKLPNVRIMDGTVVTRYESDPENARITGVHIRGHDSSGPATVLHADLVIDASGRGSQTPQRLAELGYMRPQEALVNVDYVYASRVYERPARAPEWKHLHILDRPPSSRAGVIWSVEGNRWNVMLAGCHGDHPPGDEAGFLEFARSLPVPHLHAAIAHARPLGPVVMHGFPGSQRRYYERLERFPVGLIVLGDALCSLSPIFGRGMAIGALQVALLADGLKELVARRAPNLDALSVNFRRQAADIVAEAWQKDTMEYLRFPQTHGHRSLKVRFMHWYMERLHEAGSVSERVAKRFYAVMNLLARRRELFSRDVIVDVLRTVTRRADPTSAAHAPSLPQRNSQAA